MNLFCSITKEGKRGTSLSDAAIRLIVRRYAKAAGIVQSIDPHALRRSFAQAALKGGAPLKVIQESLGHASISTTQKYLETGDQCNAGDFIGL